MVVFIVAHAENIVSFHLLIHDAFVHTQTHYSLTFFLFVITHLFARVHQIWSSNHLQCQRYFGEVNQCTNLGTRRKENKKW